MRRDLGKYVPVHYSVQGMSRDLASKSSLYIFMPRSLFQIA